jgi:hypothetical protein
MFPSPSLGPPLLSGSWSPPPPWTIPLGGVFAGALGAGEMAADGGALGTAATGGGATGGATVTGGAEGGATVVGGSAGCVTGVAGLAAAAGRWRVAGPLAAVAEWDIMPTKVATVAITATATKANVMRSLRDMSDPFFGLIEARRPKTTFGLGSGKVYGGQVRMVHFVLASASAGPPISGERTGEAGSEKVAPLRGDQAPGHQSRSGPGP